MPIHIADAHAGDEDAQRHSGLLFGLPQPAPDAAQMPEGISLCMIVKNEERFLPACLASVVGVVDEVIVIDTGSTDRTVEIAREYGCRIEFREWRHDFAWARNQALELARYRWTFVMDADEELAPSSRGLMRALRTTPAAETVIMARVVNFLEDENLPESNTSLSVRLWPSGPLFRYFGIIHENVARTDDRRSHMVDARISPITLIHKGYVPDVLQKKEKDGRNAPLLERAVKENPNDAFAWYNYANALLAANRLDEAEEAFDKCFANLDERSKSYSALAYVFRGDVDFRRGDYAKCLEWVERGLERQATLGYGLVRKGDVLRKMGKYDEAREAYKLIITGRDTAPAREVIADDELGRYKAQALIASAYLEQKDDENALIWLEEAYSDRPDHYEIAFQRAAAYERLGRFYDAELAFRDLEKTRHPNALAQYADYLIRRKRRAEAREVIDRALRDETMAPRYRARFHLAIAAISSDEREIETQLARARELAPGAFEVLGALEAHYTKRGDTAALERLAREELETIPETASDWLRRSHTLLVAERYDDAFAAATMGLAISPVDPALAYNAALAAERAGRRDEAMERLRAVEPTSGDPTSQTSAFRLALLLDQDGRTEEALASLERLRNVTDLDVDSTLLRADILERTGRAREAESELRALPATPRVAVALAGLLLRDGRLAEAGEVAAEALAS